MVRELQVVDAPVNVLDSALNPELLLVFVKTIAHDLAIETSRAEQV
jgi:hypothetical protein